MLFVGGSGSGDVIQGKAVVEFGDVILMLFCRGGWRYGNRAVDLIEVCLLFTLHPMQIAGSLVRSP
jgi:hypothetical protein